MFKPLSEQERYQITQIPNNISKIEIVKNYTFSSYDLLIANKYKSDCNRLGFLLQLGVLRHKGWPLSYINHIPEVIVSYVSEQIKVKSNILELYYKRKNTIFDQFKEVKQLYGYRIFSKNEESMTIVFLNDMYSKTDNVIFLLESCIEWLKKYMIVLPGISTIEDIVVKSKNKSDEFIIDSINEYIRGSKRKTS